MKIVKNAKLVFTSYPIASEIPSIPAPALFTTTLTCPHISIVLLAFACIVSKSEVTSNSIIRHVSGYESARSCNLLSERDVAITLSPEASAASTIERPRPLEVPIWKEAHQSLHIISSDSMLTRNKPHSLLRLCIS